MTTLPQTVFIWDGDRFVGRIGTLMTQFCHSNMLTPQNCGIAKSIIANEELVMREKEYTLEILTPYLAPFFCHRAKFSEPLKWSLESGQWVYEGALVKWQEESKLPNPKKADSTS